MNTLGKALRETSHLSPLQRKLDRLGLKDSENWIQLGIHRGCGHYRRKGPMVKDPGTDTLSNLELAVALLLNGNIYDPVNIRVAAQLLSGESDVDKTLFLTEKERVWTGLRYIAACGSILDPDNTYWKKLIEKLPSNSPPKGVLPHPDRFTTESPPLRGQLGCARQRIWLRPNPGKPG
ncbi:MAG: hypothetical protein WD708_12830 [Kiritimatiellia bacterium]